MEPTNTETPIPVSNEAVPRPPRDPSVITRTVVKRYALKVAKVRRAGKFIRVSEEFITSVESDVEAAIRGIAPYVEGVVEPDACNFITAHAMKKLRVKLNERARDIIKGKIMRHPSIGVTLK